MASFPIPNLPYINPWIPTVIDATILSCMLLEQNIFLTAGIAAVFNPEVDKTWTIRESSIYERNTIDYKRQVQYKSHN